MRLLFTYIIMICYVSNCFGQKNTAFVNANILIEGKFVKKDVYAINGMFSFNRPETLDSIIDLKGQYIIPPFADAHTHNLDREWQMSFLPQNYLNEGTFYVLNLTSKLDGVKLLRPVFEKDSTIDVAFSHQGLTSTLGHPFMAYEPFKMGLDVKVWDDKEEEIRKSRLDENNSYIFLDTKRDVEKKLPGFFAENPDVVKVFLIDSEYYTENYHNKKMGDNGLSLPILKETIKRAKAHNLDVFAHIETAYDFLKAIEAGVNYFAHMPGYGWDGDIQSKKRYEISDEVMDLAIKRDVGIIPTLGQAFNYPLKDSIQKEKFIKNFLIRFKNKGGRILIGSDAFNKTLSGEIQHFIDLNIFTPNELLKIFCHDTPKAIFPNRKIGKIEEFYEANFLVLKENPLEDINAIKGITMKVKKGYIMN
ncbi:hypothetical protein GTQ40_02860 [Flavobacteriaceae bacterium R38]|nr:hypothetical protein [Flavobacteriaceae bacterium R38]